MKRAPMPPRRQPLKAKKPLARTPMKRSALRRKPTPARGRPSTSFDPTTFSDYPPEVVAEVVRRADYRCEVRLAGCSDNYRLGLHHRLPRSPVRHDTPANLLLACADCHTASPEAIHRNPARAYAVGLLIRRSEAPPSEPWDPALRSLY